MLKTYRLLAIIFTLIVFGGRTFAEKPVLSFHPDGSFRIIQFSDTQDGANTDPRTIAGMNAILDAQKPDFVLITGDCIQGYSCKTEEQVRQAIDNIARPMESHKIPWAIVFGNHDREFLAGQKITEDQMFKMYTSHPYNVNIHSPKGVYGTTNSLLPVKSSNTKIPAFAIWLLDSNSYPPKEIHGQETGAYDYIHFTQIRWYWDKSVALEKQADKKVPSLMFFHIPLIEFKDVAASGKFVDQKNEDACPGYLNSGLFSALLDRGDVKGVFCGHDHTNTFYGIGMG